MWDIIQYLSGGMILVALLYAATAWTYKSKSEKRENSIRSASEARRADLVQTALEFFGVDAGNLAKEQKYEIALAIIRARSKHFGITAFGACVVAVPLALVLAYAMSQSITANHFAGVSRGVTQETSPPLAGTFIPTFQDLKSAELHVSEINDHLHMSVNGKDLPSLKLGETPEPIPITHLLHRGENSLTFKVDNSESGSCGVRVELWLNGRTNGDFMWHWLQDVGKAPLNSNCFIFIKPLYLSLNSQPFMVSELA